MKKRVILERGDSQLDVEFPGPDEIMSEWLRSEYPGWELIGCYLGTVPMSLEQRAHFAQMKSPSDWPFGAL